MKLQKLILLIAIYHLYTSLNAAIYYIDNLDGNDNNSGLSQEKPWASIDKVNQTQFMPGDKIQFRRSLLWQGVPMELQSSGTHDAPILVGAYDTGLPPVITVMGSVPGWDRSSTWRQETGMTWTAELSNDPFRLWLDEIEAFEADNSDALSEETPWFYDAGVHKLWIYATADPALYYCSIRQSAIAESAIIIAGQDYIHIDDLELRGGTYGCLAIYGADGIVVENCQIGYGSGVTGVWIQSKAWTPTKLASNNGVIRNCTIDSGHRLAYSFDHIYPEDGIHLRNGANQWLIENNTIQDWGHSAIHLLQDESPYTVSNNQILRNHISAAHTSYCRGLDLKGLENGCAHNIFLYNTITNTTAPNQIAGNHNTVAYNLIARVSNSQFKPYGTGQGLSLGVWDDFVCHDNRIFNNTVAYCDEAGLMVHATEDNLIIDNNAIFNNLFYECGLNSKDGFPDIVVRVTNQPQVTFNSYTHNLFYNSQKSESIYYADVFFSADSFNEQNTNDEISSNLSDNPGVIDPVNDEFRLNPTSPCIDGGKEHELTEDYFQTTLPQGLAMDIGMAEFLSSNTAVFDSERKNKLAVWPNPVFQSNHNRIQFVLPDDVEIIHILDITGRHIKTIKPQKDASWNGTNNQGDPVATGFYFYQILRNHNSMLAGRILMLK